MAERIKNYLGLAIIIALIFISVSIWSYVRAFSKSIEPSSFRSFSVSGEGEVTAIPDVAQFTFSVMTEGRENLSELQQNNTAKMNAAIDFVKSEGVASKDIKTRSYSLEPKYQYWSCPRDVSGPCPPPEIVGYKLSQVVLVKVRDFSKIGEIFSGVVSKGANAASNLSFTIDDPAEIQNQARKEAIQKAKTKARAIAEAGGFGLGRLLPIEEGGDYPIPFYGRALSLAASAEDDSAAPVIEPGSEEVKITVTLRYEIE